MFESSVLREIRLQAVDWMPGNSIAYSLFDLSDTWGVDPALMSCGLQAFGFGGGSKIRHLSLQLGLGKPGKGVREASNQRTVAEPYFAKRRFFGGGCLFQLLVAVSYTGAR